MNEYYQVIHHIAKTIDLVLFYNKHPGVMKGSSSIVRGTDDGRVLRCCLCKLFFSARIQSKLTHCGRQAAGSCSRTCAHCFGRIAATSSARVRVSVNPIVNRIFSLTLIPHPQIFLGLFMVTQSRMVHTKPVVLYII